MKSKKIKKKKHVSALEMYSSLFYDILTKGIRHNASSLGSDKMQIGYDRFFTGQRTTAYYYVTALPQEVNMSLMDDIRMYCYNDYVRLNFNINMSRHIINWNSTEMKDNREAWNRALLRSAESDSDPLGTVQEIRRSKDERRLLESWPYFQHADIDRKAIIITDLIIEVSTINNSRVCYENFDKVCDKLEKYCAMYEIGLKRIKNTVLDCMRFASPLMNDTKSFSAGIIPTRVLVDEVVANMCSYSPGKLSETGILMGIDVRTNMMVYMAVDQIMQRSLGILLAAASSGGKSVMAKCMIRELLARKVNCIVLDRDGEYKPLTEFCQGVCIDLNRSVGKYFDSMQIGRLTGYQEIDAGLLTESVVTTTSIFNVLVSASTGMNASERKIFNDAYNLLLEKAGVLKNKQETWKNSDRLSYHDLYQAIVVLSRHSAYIQRYGNVISDFVDKLSVYFSPNGLRSHLFREKIGINDILSSIDNNRAMILDICLYLDKDVDQTAEGKVEQIIKQITASYLTILLTNYFHSRHGTSMTFVEEYQRYSADCSEMQNLVLNMVTGNRKRNAGTVLITNSPAEIVRGDRATTMALTDNIKNLVLGKIESTKTIAQICETWNIPYCAQTLNEIATKPRFDKCFLFRPENGEIAIVKQYMPDELMNSPCFSTSIYQGQACSS